MAKDNVIFYSLGYVPNREVTFTDIPDYQKQYIYLMNEYVDTIRNAGGKVLTIPDSIGAWFEPVSLRDGHPSQKTHNTYAEVLYKEIVNNHYDESL